MNGIDIIILLWVIVAVIRGVEIGFLRQAFSFVGFFAGLLLGSWIAPIVAQLVDNGAGRLVVTIMITLGLAAAFAGVGEGLAMRLHVKIKFRPAQAVNASLGGGLSVVAVLIAAWLLAAALDRLPLAHLGVNIQESRVIQNMNRIMPPAPPVMERLGRLISPHGFPEVFIGHEPQTDPAGPPATPEVEAAAAKAQASTVKIEGFACGGVSVGSGFVAASGTVVTNAHVVAGVDQPVVIDEQGKHRATTVWFDPALDFAVLKTENLAGSSLALARDYAARGTSGAVLGYPGGGRLTVDPAVALGVHRAVGRDIYGRGISTREIYELQADVNQGNSGGPFVLPDGSVAGVIFGESTVRNGYSYALTSLEIADDLQAASTRTQAVDTGNCLH